MEESRKGPYDLMVSGLSPRAKIPYTSLYFGDVSRRGFPARGHILKKNTFLFMYFRPQPGEFDENAYVFI